METFQVEVVKLRRGASGNPTKRTATPDSLVKILSPGRKYLRKCTQREARSLLTLQPERFKIEHEVKGPERRTRYKKIIDLRAGVDQTLRPNSLTTVYAEMLGNTRFVETSKRVQGSTFVEWDPDLTFKELEAGLFVSAVTEARRKMSREQRRFGVK